MKGDGVVGLQVHSKENIISVAIIFDNLITSNAKLLIDKYQLKTLDSIQLGTALLLKDEIDYFIVCDSKLVKAGKKEGLKIINPVG